MLEHSFWRVCVAFHFRQVLCFSHLSYILGGAYLTLCLSLTLKEITPFKMGTLFLIAGSVSGLPDEAEGGIG